MTRNNHLKNFFSNEVGGKKKFQRSQEPTYPIDLPVVYWKFPQYEDEEQTGKERGGGEGGEKEIKVKKICSF